METANNRHPFQNNLPLLPYDVLVEALGDKGQATNANNLLELYSRRISGLFGKPVIIFDVPGGRFSFLQSNPNLNEAQAQTVEEHHNIVTDRIIREVFNIECDPKEETHINMRNQILDILKQGYVLF